MTKREGGGGTQTDRQTDAQTVTYCTYNKRHGQTTVESHSGVGSYVSTSSRTPRVTFGGLWQRERDAWKQADRRGIETGRQKMHGDRDTEEQTYTEIYAGWRRSLPMRNETERPRYRAMAPRVVAVARSPSGNQEADNLGAPELETGPPSPFRK